MNAQITKVIPHDELDALAAELAQLKGKMAADKKVMDELSDAAARGRNLEVT